MRCEIGAIAFVAACAIAIWIDWKRLCDWPRGIEIGFYIVPPHKGNP